MCCKKIPLVVMPPIFKKPDLNSSPREPGNPAAQLGAYLPSPVVPGSPTIPFSPFRPPNGLSGP